MKDLAAKTAFITGGASGLGLAMAHSLSSAGMKVAIADIEQAALDSAIAGFADSNTEVKASRCAIPRLRPGGTTG